MNAKSLPALQRLASPTEFKFAGSSGSFDGYAAVFGNVDSGGDVIEPGAFKELVKTRDGKVLILYQHSARDPIGKATVEQDSHGLKVRGNLAIEDPTAAKAYGLMKSGVLDAMSIGYEILPGGSESMQSGARKLTGLKLYEVSLVTFGMNALARVDSVKSALDCENPRELERLLRDAPQFQFSSRKAKAAANALWPILTAREAQDDARDERSDQFLKFASQLSQFTNLLKGI